ncbi:MAG: hypothetical protein DCC71_00580 [Proteobacteria bacterium]|nr:MAG: hypothetical protein DCC71_00580 [Pseudomonadota bacterium]
MLRAMRSAALLALAVVATAAPPGAAAIFVNEIMASPGAADWNQDGVADALADEYVEIVNRGAREVDVGGWTLSDEVGVRHVIAFFTILRPGGALVVFGGGSPAGLPGFAVAASTGALGLNNAGDTLELHDGTAVVDSVAYGSATAGVSWNRAPDAEASAPLALHDAVPGAVGDGSPGRGADQAEFQAPPLSLPFINEWLPRPLTLANDWNGDGVADDLGDEFVEIVNPADGTTIDLEGWTLRDAATPYHTFAPGTLLAPGASIVVVAGVPAGIPGLAVQGISWGNISNSLEDLYLADEQGDLVSHVRHDGQTADIAWNRDPDASPSTPFFALHYDVSPGHLFSSPGRAADGTPFPTPEPHGAPLAAALALGALARRRARRRIRIRA